MAECLTFPTPEGPRTYHVHGPQSPGPPWPVVVMLHGAGGTAEWTLRETRWDEYADRAGFLLALPEATRRDPTRPASFLDNPQVWNDGATDAEPARPAVDDVASLSAMLDDLAMRYSLDAERIYLTGFSNGAAMAFRYTASCSDRIAAVAPVAGYCHLRDPHLARPVPTLYVVGRMDPLVPWLGGEIVTPWNRRRMRRPAVASHLVKWAEAIQCERTTRTVTQDAGLTLEVYPGQVPFLVYTIDDLGHHWPGGRGELNRRIAGPPSNRVEGCKVIWEFFRQHHVGRS